MKGTVTADRRPIGVLSLRVADRNNPNAQHVTTREIFARLPEGRFKLTLFSSGEPDPRLAARPHVRIVPLASHGKAFRIIREGFAGSHDLVFHPNPDLADTRIIRTIRLIRPRLGLAVHVVNTVEDGGDGGTVRKRLESLVRQAALLTANSSAVADSVRRAFGRPPIVVLNGIDLSVFYPGDLPRPSPFVAAVVGSFQARKRYDLVLEAARRFPNSRFWCVGAGPSPLKPYVEEEVKRLGLRNVEILEPMEHPRLADRLRASHVLFHPSVKEGAPQVILQAQACGCVPIARSTYRPPTIVEGLSGLIAPDDEGLLAAFGRALENRVLLKRLRAGALKAAADLSWDAIVEQWAALLENAFRDSGPGSLTKATACN